MPYFSWDCCSCFLGFHGFLSRIRILFFFRLAIVTPVVILSWSHIVVLPKACLFFSFFLFWEATCAGWSFSLVILPRSDSVFFFVWCVSGVLIPSPLFQVSPSRLDGRGFQVLSPPFLVNTSLGVFRMSCRSAFFFFRVSPRVGSALC